MLTPANLAESLGLDVVAGAAGADQPIRWIHLSELPDPTPWMSGGEFLLTTGPALKDARAQRAYVKRLDKKGVSGIGFSIGFDHDSVPKALAEAAEAAGVPIVEVPFETPFIAITEHAFTRLVNENYTALERGIEIHERLERLVLQGHGIDRILGTIGDAIGGPVLVVDREGVELGRGVHADELSRGDVEGVLGLVRDRTAEDRTGPFMVEDGSLADRALVLPIPAGAQSIPQSWLIVTRSKGVIGDMERLLARQAAMVVALEMMRSKVVRDTERRLAGDVLAEALAGGIAPERMQTRLAPFGLGARIAVLVFEVGDPDRAVSTLEEHFSAVGVGALVAVSNSAGRPLLCAVVDSEGDPIELARAGRAAIVGTGVSVRASASQGLGVGEIKRGFHEARCALDATSFRNGDAPEVASHRDLGAFTLLLAVQDDEALRAYSDSLLVPVEEADAEYGSELLRSLEAFIENNGQWERAASKLYCHRHTLRYRIRRIEELTGRDMGNAQDRIEMWLAIQARELVQ